VMRLPAALSVGLLLVACTSSARPSPSGEAAASPPLALATSGREVAIERVVAAEAPQRPDQPILDAAFRIALVGDYCVDRDLPAPPAVDPALTVLDRSYALDPGYAPSDLVAASAAGFSDGSGSKLVRSVVVDDLAALAAASREEGLALGIESAYRSYASQAATLQVWTARLGPAAALLRTARPGHSEHQLGTAIDFTSPGWAGRVGDWAVESLEGAWMAEHAWEYGFVMSYPSGAEGDTCFGYEPWHYRWVGRDAAAEQRGAGVPLRDFLERYAVP
jgi:zinc D-Ala-D-Ala carboxypeptidase